jgi:hypothetical protein
MGRAGNVDEDDDDGVDDLHAILDARSPSTDDSNGFVALLCIGPIFIFKPADDVHHPPGTFEETKPFLVTQKKQHQRPHHPATNSTHLRGRAQHTSIPHGR